MKIPMVKGKPGKYHQKVQMTGNPVKCDNTNG
jgi:hypothetical protein